MDGISLTSEVITGVKSGIADSFGMIGGTINNEYLIELAVMFFGVLFVLALVSALMFRHKRMSPVSDYGFYAPLDRNRMLSETDSKLLAFYADASSRSEASRKIKSLEKQYGTIDDAPLSAIDNKEYERVTKGHISGAEEHDRKMAKLPSDSYFAFHHKGSQKWQNYYARLSSGKKATEPARKWPMF